VSNLKEKNIQPFEEGVIQGVQVRPLKKHRDDRGWLMELFRADEIDSDMMPAMSYVSETLPGVTGDGVSRRATESEQEKHLGRRR